MLPIAMGNSDFREIREKGYYFVDKSLLIRELLQDASKVVLIPRPRRFGKTLNLKMCEAFFSDQQPNRQWFEGLAIADDVAAMRHFGAYPTIAMTFKDLHADSWESCQIKLQSLISKLFLRFKDRIQPDASQQGLIQDFLERRAPIELVEEALQILADLLYQSTGKKVFLFIDEYDAPIQDGHFYGFYDKIVAFCRRFFGSVLKDYPYLHKGVLTGVLRIAQESLFSGLNNIQVSTVLDHGYSRHFGFTEAEVTQILHDFDLGDRASDIRNWYNGYRIGAVTLFNPWSILSVAARKPESLESFWINTSQDKLIENLITTEHCISLEELTHLLRGEGLIKEIWPALSLNRIDGQSIWSLLLFSGYVTFDERESETSYRLRLPNREVRFYFERIVRRWIEGPSGPIEQLKEILVQGRLDDFQKYLTDRVGANTGGPKSGLGPGQGEAAAAAFAKDLANTERLAASEPGSADLQRELSVSYCKMGDLYQALGRGEEAAAAYGSALANAERLAAVQPGRADLMRDLAVSCERMGDLYQAQGRVEEAAAAYARSLAILERLTASEPARADAQRDLAVGHNKMGDLYRAQGRGEAAAAAYTRALAIRERLAASEPGRADVQRDLAVSYERMGQLALDGGQKAQAQALFLRSQGIMEALILAEPNRADYLRQLAVTLYLVASADEEAPWRSLRRAYALLLELKQTGRLDPVDEPILEHFQQAVATFDRSNAPSGDAL